MGELSDSTLIATKLAPHDRILVASRAYLEQHGVPEDEAVLRSHRLLDKLHGNDLDPAEVSALDASTLRQRTEAIAPLLRDRAAEAERPRKPDPGARPLPELRKGPRRCLVCAQRRDCPLGSVTASGHSGRAPRPTL